MAAMIKKNYVLLNNDNSDDKLVFSSRQPRGAALKAATRGKKEIRLRERGTNRVHVFKGWTEMVAAPSNAPSWLPDKIKKANVKKLRIERV